ncbi:MAG: hypothetical protein Q9157_003850 [Trypethelium eluteriae]
MEIYQELGLYDQMRAESAKSYDENSRVVAVESLAGKLIQTFASNINEGIENVSSAGRLFLTQDKLEPMLRKEAIQNGIDLRFSTEMISFEQDDKGATALIRSVESGEKNIVRAEYLVACDGVRSSVRDKLGIKVNGHGLLSHSLTIYFKADVSKYLEDQYNGVIYVNNPTVRGFFRIDRTGQQGFLVVFTAGKQGTKESRFPADNVTDEQASEYLRAAIGNESIQVQIESIAKWRAVCDNAQRYNVGRVILAGDSAHAMTPQGGYGGNTGIQDVHNLAWKLALLINGRAGRELVEQTYHEERFPVGQKTVNQVLERYVVRSAPEMKKSVDYLEEELPDTWLELGFRYHSSAFMADELGELNEDPLVATARAGSRAPHVYIKTAAGDSSDASPYPISRLCDGNFVFVLGEKADQWKQAAQETNSCMDLPQVIPYKCRGRDFLIRYGISPFGAVLLRPDGFVAWKTWQDPVPGVVAASVLRDVMERILCLNGKESLQAVESINPHSAKTISNDLSVAGQEKKTQVQFLDLTLT